MRCATRLTCLLALALAVASAVLSPPANADELYGLFNNGPSGSGDSLTLARVDRTTGAATPLTSYVSSFHGFSNGLAFDKASGKFVSAGYDSGTQSAALLVIDLFTPTPSWSEVSLGLDPGYYAVVGVEFVPKNANTTNGHATAGLYVSYGPVNANANENTRMAQVDLGGNLIQDVAAPLGMTDIDAIAYDPLTRYLINTDPNNEPYEMIAGNIFGSPTFPIYASPPNNGELWDGAFSPNAVDLGTFYVGSRDTSTLWKLNPTKDDFIAIGSFNMGGALPAGLAFAAPEPGTAGMLAMGAAVMCLARLRRRPKRS